MEIGSIPWDRCVSYAERAGLDGVMIDAFADIVAIMDEAYIAYMREKAEKDAKTKHPPKGGSVSQRK